MKITIHVFQHTDHYYKSYQRIEFIFTHKYIAI